MLDSPPDGPLHQTRPRPRRMALIREVVDAVRHFDVELGDAADILGGEAQDDLRVSDTDLRMVVGILGHLGDQVHEIHRLGEVLELNGSLDGFTFEFPVGHFFQGGGESAFIKQIGHNAAG